MDLMDLSRLEPPKKENKTPMKVMNGSRPSSPDREIVRFYTGQLFLFILMSLHILAIGGIYSFNFFLSCNKHIRCVAVVIFFTIMLGVCFSSFAINFLV